MYNGYIVYIILLMFTFTIIATDGHRSRLTLYPLTYQLSLEIHKNKASIRTRILYIILNTCIMYIYIQHATHLFAYLTINKIFLTKILQSISY